MKTARMRILVGVACLGIFAGASVGQTTLPEMFPGETMVYVGWPGSGQLDESFAETAMAKMLDDPQVDTFRDRLTDALDQFLAVTIENEEGQQAAQAYALTKALLEGVYRHPTAIAFVNVNAKSVIPLVDAGMVVRAGEQSAELADKIDAIIEATEAVPMESVKSVKIGPHDMKELAIMGPAMSLRWGVIDGSLVVTFGNRVLKHLVPEYLARPAQDEAADAAVDEQDAGAPADAEADAANDPTDATEPPPAEPTEPAAPIAKNLAENPRFVKAMEVTGGSPDLPVVFVDLSRVVGTLEDFQPLMAGFQVPVLGEPGGVRRILAQAGVEDPQSLSMVWSAAAGGLKTTTFLHAPGMGAFGEPLSDADLAVIPQHPSWAAASNVDLLGLYDGILQLVAAISEEAHAELTEFIAMAEQRMGMSMRDDLIGSFGDTWVMYDTPESGSVLSSGITLVADVKDAAKIDAALRQLVQIIGEEAGEPESITVRYTGYRNVNIAFLNFEGLPIPFAPAWAFHEGRMVVALFPQMVQAALAQMMNEDAPSLLANEGFQRGREVVPQNPSSVNYIDAHRGIRNLYSIALPVSSALVGMGQQEGFDIDIAAMPPLMVIDRHLFDNVGGAASTPDGYISVSYGAVPAVLPALGQNMTVGPMMVAVLLPSLARARELSKRTVSAANLKGVGTAMFAYAMEHDDKLPPDLQTLIDMGAISPRSLISPRDDDPGPDGSYVFIAPGRELGDLEPDTIIMYEDMPEYGEGTNALFADGHVEWMMSWTFEERLEESKSRLGIDEDNDADSDGMNVVDESHGGDQSDAERAEAVDLVQRLVARGGIIATAIDTYRVDVGEYPSRLEDLVSEPEQEALAEKWRGPYIKDGDEMLNDLWGHRLKYLRPGEINRGSYDLWSVGPDGESGTKDDISNFKTQAR